MTTTSKVILELDKEDAEIVGSCIAATMLVLSDHKFLTLGPLVTDKSTQIGLLAVIACMSGISSPASFSDLISKTSRETFNKKHEQLLALVKTILDQTTPEPTPNPGG